MHTSSGTFEASSLMDGYYPNELGLREPLPKGSMDDQGYLTFTARTAPATAQGTLGADILPDCLREIRGPVDPMVAISYDDTIWLVEDRDIELSDSIEAKQTNTPRTHIVILGWYQKFYPGASLAQTDNIKAMLIQEHAPERYHIISYASLHSGYRFRVMSWARGKFCVGGPDRLS